MRRQARLLGAQVLPVRSAPRSHAFLAMLASDDATGVIELDGYFGIGRGRFAPRWRAFLFPFGALLFSHAFLAMLASDDATGVNELDGCFGIGRGHFAPRWRAFLFPFGALLFSHA
ncbi:MAG: hypothetical protein ACYCX4_08140, partial [Bacillota bacterium]